MNKHGKSVWLCECECGNTTEVINIHLKNGNTKSCGCLQHLCGKDNPNYNPDLTDDNRVRGRHIPGYSAWVKAILKRDNYTCQICGDNTGGNLIAHHIESYHDNPELRTKLSNGATVCERHHSDFHHQYGYGHNTRKQFEEFKEEFQKGGNKQ